MGKRRFATRTDGPAEVLVDRRLHEPGPAEVLRLSQYDRDDDRALFPKRSTTSNSRVKLIVKDTIPNSQSFDW